MSDERDEFFDGQRVELSEWGIQQRIQGRAPTRYGTVLYPMGAHHVRVRRDGMKGAEKYHVDFWQPLGPGSTAAGVSETRPTTARLTQPGHLRPGPRPTKGSRPRER